MSLIKLENVSKIYPTASENFVAVKNVNFTLNSGEMIAIMGSSGSGKSTLMNIMGFLDRCSSGRYLFEEQDVSHLVDDDLAKLRNEKIGFVFQSFFLLPRLTALQNVMLPLFYRGEEASNSEQLALRMLDKVGMRNFSTHKPNQLSGGQQQRVAIARALVGEPQVIFADEPTGSLDSNTSNEVMKLFLSLNETEKRTIVIITHDKEIGNRCQRIVSLKDGSIIENS